MLSPSVPAKHMQAHTRAHRHTCALAVILEGPFFHVIPVPGSSKTHTDAHTQVDTQRTCTHIHTHTHMHTCSDPRRPLLSCYPHACSSKTHADAHTQVHMQRTYAHTHAHTCTQSSQALVLLLPIAPLLCQLHNRPQAGAPQLCPGILTPHPPLFHHVSHNIAVKAVSPP